MSFKISASTKKKIRIENIQTYGNNQFRAVLWSEPNERNLVQLIKLIHVEDEASQSDIVLGR